MRSTVAVLLFAAGCGDPSSAEYCNSTCAFYSECDPNVAPLEAMCVQTCNARFADGRQIIDQCGTVAPRHPVDQFRALPSVRSSVFEAGECFRDRCPIPGEADRCAGVEQICIDSLGVSARCERTRRIANYNCTDGYQRCIAAGREQSGCAAEEATCFQAVNQSC